MFITFEGIDGCGKSTQLDLLSKYLIARGDKVICLREPGSLPLSEKIRSILLDPNEHIHPITELLLFEASRSHLVNNLIEPKLKEGNIIICDRFYDSTTAYQGYGRGINLELIHNLNNIASLGRSPDITIFLDIEYEESIIRSGHRKHDRIEKAGKEFFLKLINAFRELAKTFPERIIQINANDEKHIVHQRIIDAVTKRMLKNE